MLAKLPILDGEILQRAVLASEYTKRFSDIKTIHTPKVDKIKKSAWAQYTIQVNERQILQDMLSSSGVPTAVHYPLALHHQPAVSSEGTDLLVSEKLASSVLSLPFNAYMSDLDFHLICDTIIQFHQGR